MAGLRNVCYFAAMNITDFAALVGAITGPAALLIAFLVYFRDRAGVDVGMQWDMSTYGPGSDAGKTYLVVTAHNVGRRPIYVSHAHIRLPRGADPEVSHIILIGAVEGKTLPEGAAPYLVHADQEGLDKYAGLWWKLRATVIDSAGKHYHSDWPTKAPLSGSDVAPPFGAVAWNQIRNWARRRLP